MRKNGRKESKILEQLTVSEWKVLKDYSSSLRPVSIALDILQGDRRACQGYVLPTLFVIKASLEENICDRTYVSDYGLIMNETVLKCLENRFGSIMTFTEENEELILAASIHPNFKISWIQQEKDREYAH